MRRQSRMLACCFLAAGLAASGLGAQAYATVIADAIWQQQPTNNDLLQALSYRAIVWKRSGAAQLKCRVKADGLLENCAVVSQTDQEFGRAALRVVPKFRMKTQTLAQGAEPAEGEWVVIPFKFAVRMR